MTPDPPKRNAAELGQEALELTRSQLFIQYVAMGGNESAQVLDEFLDHDGHLSDAEFDKLAAGLNDEFTDRGGDHPIPSSDEFS